MRVPRIRGYLFGVPMLRIIVSWGIYWGITAIIEILAVMVEIIVRGMVRMAMTQYPEHGTLSLEVQVDWV